MSDRGIAVKFSEERVDQLFSTRDWSHEPGCAVGIARHGIPLYRKGFGLANMELPVALSPSMRMRIGSITKHFTCLLALLLTEQGRLQLEDTIAPFVPELGAEAAQTTIRHLMSHTSGLYCSCTISLLFAGGTREVSSRRLFDQYSNFSGRQTPAGHSWIYNNGAYIVLGLVIERALRIPLQDLFRQYLFEPAGMNDTLLRAGDRDYLINSASLHLRAADGNFFRDFWLDWAGAGAIVSTIDDMLRWLRNFHHPMIGSKKSWDQMRTPGTLNNGASTRYSLGLMISRYRGLQIIHHSGAAIGGNAQMIHAPELGLDVVAISNRQDLDSTELCSRIIDTCVSGLSEDTATTTGLTTGVFRSTKTGKIIQLLTSEEHQIVSFGAADLKFYWADKETLLPAGSNAFLNISVKLEGDRQSPRAISLNEFGNVDTLTKLDAVVERSSDIDGAYYCDEVCASATIETVGEQKILETILLPLGNAKHELREIAEDVWRSKQTGTWPIGAILSFAHDRASFDMTCSMMKPFRFKRTPIGSANGESSQRKNA